jgi:hypothetical protein
VSLKGHVTAVVRPFELNPFPHDDSCDCDSSDMINLRWIGVVEAMIEMIMPMPSLCFMPLICKVVLLVVHAALAKQYFDELVTLVPILVTPLTKMSDA